jgi:hypothetical protein
MPQNRFAVIYSYSLQTWSMIIPSNAGWKPAFHEPPGKHLLFPACKNHSRLENKEAFEFDRVKSYL